ncbi:hypothetical protein F3K24_27735 [Streptomyces sp. LBUM 1485]|nr:hypothetical protein [Streptomyces sp. LBUM 1485]
MAWWHPFSRRRALPAPKPLPTPEGNALTAAAAPVTSPRTELIRTPDTWQDEAWQYYSDLGEFRYAADWEANMLSRVRFYAAKLEPGTDEPVRADAGTAVDLMTTFAGGVAGQAQIMAGLGTQLSVPARATSSSRTSTESRTGPSAASTKSEPPAAGTRSSTRTAPRPA